MAYANIVFENSKTKKEITSPLGFSWPMIFIPFLFGIVLTSLTYLFTALSQESDLFSFLLSSLILLKLVVIFSFAVIPLYRKDTKWAIIMAIGGSVSYGSTAILFSFFYNYIYIIKLLKNGYHIKNILNVLDSHENKLTLENLNPIEYSAQYQEYFIWVDIFSIKYMKYFDTKEKASSYIENHPANCMRIKHIVKTVNRLGRIDSTLKERFNLPIKTWIHNIENKFNRQASVSV